LLPKGYLPWEQWRENGGKPPRPIGLRYPIPQTWWVLYAARHIKPKPIFDYNGFFAQNHGALFRTPGGNIEHVDQQSVYLKWSGLNLRASGNWATQLSENTKYKVISLPWQQCFSVSDIDAIFNVAPTLNLQGHCILNVEQEILTILTPTIIREKIAAYKMKNPTAEVAVVPLPWVQNNQGWSALKDIPVLIEVFTNEMAQFTAAVCVEHARKEGLGIVGCLWGSYAINGVYPNPKMYPLSSYKIQAIYTGDDVQNWSDWVVDPIIQLGV
jgi:hypothetical protein